MTRDPDIQKIFEIADDSLQGVLGYNLYIMALQKTANPSLIMKYLPNSVDDTKQPAIPLTFSWIRYYRKEELLEAFKEPVFEFFQSRITLLAMVSVFEVALGNFIATLNEKGHTQLMSPSDPAYKKLKWAYASSINCDIGDKKAIVRLSLTYSIIDNARRLRNLIVHNQGIFDESYKTQAIEFEDSKIEFHNLYEVYENNRNDKIPVILNGGDVIRFSQAHIEVLHILHNYLQKEYFGFPRPYNYSRENKPIKWDKVLWGEAKVASTRAQIYYKLS